MKTLELPEIASGLAVPSTPLLDCPCCGMRPAFVQQETDDKGWAVECVCGRRSAWWLTKTKARSDWTTMIARLT